MIKSYSFGRLVFNRKLYTKDLIILSKGSSVRVIDNWWRKEGHFLQVEDLEEVWEFKPEVLVIGTGASGVMRVSKDVFTKAKELGIEVISQLTSEAVKSFNSCLNQGKKVAGAFHLTC